MQIESIAIIGYGAFGVFLHELLTTYRPEIECRIYSRRHAPDGATFFTLPEAASADAVVLCGAIRDFRVQLESVLPHLQPETILVDVSTVKQYTSECLRELVGEQRFVATHPMFGPESYKKQGETLADLRLVITDYVLLNDEYVRFKRVLESLGLSVIELAPAEHDQILAETLFLTHHIAQTVKMGSFVRSEIDTVSFGFLMDAVESVAGDTALFRDVYRFNPYCKQVLERYDAAETRVLQDILGKT